MQQNCAVPSGPVAPSEHTSCALSPLAAPTSSGRSLVHAYEIEPWSQPGRSAITVHVDGAPGGGLVKSSVVTSWHAAAATAANAITTTTSDKLRMITSTSRPG